MVKDAYEDYKRHKADNLENETESMVFNRDTGTF
jgi:hypothetical protein